MKLTDSFFDVAFEHIAFLDDEGRVSMVRKSDTNQVYIKKEISAEIASVYKKILNLNNCHVAKIEYVYSLDEKSFVIEEYISGRTVHEMVMQYKVLDGETARDYCVQILDGLSAIHSLGIIHRDISPKNIIVTNDGICKILDFDISRAEKPGKTQDTTILGTAGFASPEQFGFLQTSEQSDIYSVGVLFNFMLTGTLPTVNKPEKKSLRKIVEKATSINPKDRYANAGQMIRVIESNDSYNWLPGFRSEVRWKKIIAGIVYAVCWLFFVIYILDAIINNREFIIKEIASAAISFVVSPFIAGNIFYWDKKIPLLRKFPRYLRLIIRIIVFCVVLYYGMELYVGVSDHSVNSTVGLIL